MHLVGRFVRSKLASGHGNRLTILPLHLFQSNDLMYHFGSIRPRMLWYFFPEASVESIWKEVSFTGRQSYFSAKKQEIWIQTFGANRMRTNNLIFSQTEGRTVCFKSLPDLKPGCQ